MKKAVISARMKRREHRKKRRLEMTTACSPEEVGSVDWDDDLSESELARNRDGCLGGLMLLFAFAAGLAFILYFVN